MLRKGLFQKVKGLVSGNLRRVGNFVVIALVLIAGQSLPSAASTYSLVPNSASTTLDQVVQSLVGTTPFSGAKFNGLTSGTDFEKSIQTTATFSGGTDVVGVDSGLVITADAKLNGLGARTENFSQVLSNSSKFGAGSLPTVLSQVAQNAGLSSSVYSASTLEFTLSPSSSFLKITYSLVYTESGGYNPANGTWGGAVFGYPDGLGIFIRPSGQSWAANQNCAVIPTTTTYVTMQTAGIVAPNSPSLDRATAKTNYDNLVSGSNTDSPPKIAFQTGSELKVGDTFATVPLTCVVDVSAFVGSSVDVGIVVANLGDNAVAPAVFFAGNSIGFSDNSVATAVTEEPEADPSTSPVVEDATPAEPLSPRAPRVPSFDAFQDGPAVIYSGEDLALKGSRLTCTTFVEINSEPTKFAVETLNDGSSQIRIAIPKGLEPGPQRMSMDSCDGEVTFENLLFIPKPPAVFEAATSNAIERGMKLVELRSFVLERRVDYNHVDCVVNTSRENLQRVAKEMLGDYCKAANNLLAKSKSFSSKLIYTHKPANVWVRITLSNK